MIEQVVPEWAVYWVWVVGIVFGSVVLLSSTAFLLKATLNLLKAASLKRSVSRISDVMSAIAKSQHSEEMAAMAQLVLLALNPNHKEYKGREQQLREYLLDSAGIQHEDE